MRCVLTIALMLMMVTAAMAEPASPAPPTGTLKDYAISERSPLSTLEESFRRTPRQFTGQKTQTLEEMTGPERERLDYDIAKESVDMVVPPAARDGKPYGVLVWQGVGTLSEKWLGAIAKRRLIYVTPNNCDGRSPWIRRGLAIDAVEDLKKHYKVDPQRVYLSGFSAGAHLSAALIAQFPDVFHGDVCLMGGHYYRPNYLTPAKGTRFKDVKLEPTILGPSWFGDIDQLKKELRLVSVFGAEDDIVPAGQGRIDHECLRLDGFQHTYIELAGQPHRAPSLATFERALAALDAKPSPAPTTAPIKGDARPHADQLAQAKRLLNTAKMVYDAVSRIPPGSKSAARLTDMAKQDPAYDAAFARRCLAEMAKNYPTTPSAEEGRALLAKFEALPVTGPTTRPATKTP
jgi:pimeloyl-ACP methyl ester carboxylesterase